MVEVLGKKSSSSGEGNEEKKATIVDLEAIPSDAVNQSSSRDADNVAHISRQDLQSGIIKLRNALQCSICVELFTDPQTVDCAFAAVEIYLTHLSSPSERDNHRKRVESGKEVLDPWANIFHRDRPTTYLQDDEDDTRRCLRCNWELVGQECVNCGEMYYDAPDDSDEGESVNTRENESEQDDNESVDSFVVDDDVVDYEDDHSGSDGEEYPNEASDDEATSGRRRRRRGIGRRNPPAVVELDSQSDENEDSASYNGVEELSRLEEAESDDDVSDTEPLIRRRGRRNEPAVYELDSESHDSDESESKDDGGDSSDSYDTATVDPNHDGQSEDRRGPDVHEVDSENENENEDDESEDDGKLTWSRSDRDQQPTTMELGSESQDESEEDAQHSNSEESKRGSDYDSDFQSPPPQTRKRKMKEKKSKRKSRRVIALDDSDNDGLQEPSHGRASRRANGHKHHHESSKKIKREQKHAVASDEESDSESEGDLEQALLELDQQYSKNGSAGESNKKYTKQKKDKKKKKKSKSHDGHPKRKDKGKGREEA
ncbi:E3 ubiquitin ligase [Umbelopsis nana]